jgi:O-antigen ligase
MIETIQSKYFKYALFLYAFSFPFFRISTSYSIIPLLILSAILIYKNKLYLNTNSTKFIRIIACNFFLIVGLLTIDINHINNASHYLLLRISFLFLSLILTLIEIDTKTFKNILFSFIVGVLFFCIIANILAIYYFINTNRTEVFIYTFLVSFTDHSPAYISFFALISLIFCDYLYANKYFLFHNKLTYNLMYFIISLNIVLLFSRIFLLLFSILLIVKIFKSILKFQFNLKLIFSYSLMFVLLYYFMDKNYFIHYRFRNYMEYREMTTYKKPEDRILIWECGLSALKQKPYFGYGTGNSKDILLKTYQEKKMDHLYSCKFNAHNQYLETALESGIIFASLFLVLILYTLVRAIRDRNYLYINVLCILCVFMFFESFLMTQSGCYFTAFFLPLLFFNMIKSKDNVIQ